MDHRRAVSKVLRVPPRELLHAIPQVYPTDHGAAGLAPARLLSACRLRRPRSSRQGAQAAAGL